MQYQDDQGPRLDVVADSCCRRTTAPIADVRGGIKRRIQPPAPRNRAACGNGRQFENQRFPEAFTIQCSVAPRRGAQAVAAKLCEWRPPVGLVEFHAVPLKADLADEFRQGGIPIVAIAM